MMTARICKQCRCSQVTHSNRRAGELINSRDFARWHLAFVGAASCVGLLRGQQDKPDAALRCVARTIIHLTAAVALEVN